MGLGDTIRSGGKWAVQAAAALLALLILLLIGFRIAAAAREGDTARPAATRMVATPLGEVAVQLAGPADGPPVLLVHGTAGWSGFWRNVSAHLAARGWRVIAVDLPPFGYSEHDPRGALRPGEPGGAAGAGDRRGTAGRPAVVVGHSFGSGAAVELALRDPGTSVAAGAGRRGLGTDRSARKRVAA